MFSLTSLADPSNLDRFPNVCNESNTSTTHLMLTDLLLLDVASPLLSYMDSSHLCANQSGSDRRLPPAAEPCKATTGALLFLTCHSRRGITVIKPIMTIYVQSLEASMINTTLKPHTGSYSLQMLIAFHKNSSVTCSLTYQQV